MINEPHCQWCGKPLKKATFVWWCRPEPRETDRPTSWLGYKYGIFYTRADCQKVVNQPVVSIHFGPNKTISWFSTWDGESYKGVYGELFFDTNMCAVKWANNYLKKHPELRR